MKQPKSVTGPLRRSDYLGPVNEAQPWYGSADMAVAKSVSPIVQQNFAGMPAAAPPGILYTW
ncbi:MAG: hypothetical protein Tsb002_12060 [Wenzhouxiangellaceae bacterium]